MWQKSGRFRNRFNMGHGTQLRQKCVFKCNDAASIVREVGLYGYDSGTIRIQVRYDSCEIADNFINQAREKFINDTSDRFIFPDTVKFQTNDKNHLHIFLQEVRSFAPIIDEIYTDICSELDIEPFETNINVILNMPLSDARVQLLESQEHQKFDTIWEFCNILYQDSLEDEPRYGYDSQLIYDLLNLVSKDNPFYGQTQDLIVQLLMRTGLDSGELRDDLKLKFRHALNGTNQQLTDQLYKQLCGQSIGCEFTANVCGDADTLIDLADRFFQMSQQLKFASVNPQGFFANQSINCHSDIDSTNTNTNTI